jgi:membrane-associated phospholipid phosphatase
MYTNRDTHKEQKQIHKESDYPSKACLAGFGIGLILLVATALMAHTHQLNGWQLSVFRSVDNLNLGSFWTTFAKWVTEALGAAYPMIICVVASLAYRRYKLAWRFFFTAGGATAVFYVIKKIINEPRPIAMLHGNVHQRVVETGPGFPSGHETMAVALALTLWAVLPSKWRWLSIMWILIVGFSRLYLGVHTPGDIIGGFAVGLMAVTFVRLLPSKLAKWSRLDLETILNRGW